MHLPEFGVLLARVFKLTPPPLPPVLRPRSNVELIAQSFKDKSKLDRVLADPRVYTGTMQLQTGLQLMALAQASSSAGVCVLVRKVVIHPPR
jgi:hypothetical protein